MTTAELLEQRYPARAAREAAGLTLDEAAARVRLKRSTLRGYEYRQWFAYGVARALAKLYGCSINVFLPHRAAAGPAPRGSGARRGAPRSR